MIQISRKDIEFWMNVIQTIVCVSVLFFKLM